MDIEKKLTKHQAKKMREEYLDGFKQAELALYYKISKKMVYNIIHLKYYADVGLPLEKESYLEAVYLRSFRKRGQS
jgi:hypothetical protein